MSFVNRGVEESEGTSWLAVFFMLICVSLSSVAQLFYKFGMETASFKNFYSVVRTVFFNWPVPLGLFLYGVALIFLILSFQRGELSVLYPLFALSYVFVSFLSPLFFNSDYMTFINWIGIFLIVVGVSLIGRGGGVGEG